MSGYSNHVKEVVVYNHIQFVLVCHHVLFCEIKDNQVKSFIINHANHVFFNCDSRSILSNCQDVSKLQLFVYQAAIMNVFGIKSDERKTVLNEIGPKYMFNVDEC